MLLLQLTMRMPPPTDVAERTVPLVAGSAANISSDAAATAGDAGVPPVNAAVASSEAGALAAPPTDAVGKTVPPVAGAAAGTAADAEPADDAGASATPFNDVARKTQV